MTKMQRYGEDFFEDVARAKTAEAIVLNALEANKKAGTEIIDVSENPEYYDRGDILIRMSSGKEVFVDVKDDTCVGRTGNVFVEECAVYESGYVGEGWIHSDYDFIAICSRDTCTIYIIDFAKLKRLYRQLGKPIACHFSDHSTYGTLVSLDNLRNAKVLRSEIHYRSSGI